MKSTVLRAAFLLAIAGGTVALTASAGSRNHTALRTEIEPNNDSANANALVLGDTVVGTLNEFQNFDWFDIHLTAGTIIDFRTTRGYLVLRNWHPYSQVGHGARITLLIPETGKYYIGLHHDNPGDPVLAGLGPYTMIVGEPPSIWIDEAEPNEAVEDATPITPADTAMGSSSGSGDVDSWRVTLPAGTLVDIVVPTGHETWTVRDPSGAVIADRIYDTTPEFGEPSVVTFRGTSAGVYTLTLEAGAGHVYTFYLRVHDTSGWRSEDEPNDAPAAAQLVDLGDTLNATIDSPGDADFYAFDAAEGDWIDPGLRDVSNGMLKASVTVLWPDGTTPYPAGGRFQLPAGGRWFVRVADTDGEGSAAHGYLLSISQYELPVGVYSHIEGAPGAEQVPPGDTLVIGTIFPANDTDLLVALAPPGFGLVILNPYHVSDPRYESPYGMKLRTQECTVTSCTVLLDYEPTPDNPNAGAGAEWYFGVFRYPRDLAVAARDLMVGDALTEENRRGLDLSGSRGGGYDITDLYYLYHREGGQAQGSEP